MLAIVPRTPPLRVQRHCWEAVEEGSRSGTNEPGTRGPGWTARDRMNRERGARRGIGWQARGKAVLGFSFSEGSLSPAYWLCRKHKIRPAHLNNCKYEIAQGNDDLVRFSRQVRDLTRFLDKTFKLGLQDTHVYVFDRTHVPHDHCSPEVQAFSF